MIAYFDKFNGFLSKTQSLFARKVSCKLKVLCLSPFLCVFFALNVKVSRCVMYQLFYENLTKLFKQCKIQLTPQKQERKINFGTLSLNWLWTGYFAIFWACFILVIFQEWVFSPPHYVYSTNGKIKTCMEIAYKTFEVRYF